MADCVEEGTFWLPSEFFDDFLKDSANSEVTRLDESVSEFCFPTEFPYELGTQTDNHLKWAASTSPQSTLVNGSVLLGRSAGGSSNGSPDGVASPPLTPLSGGNDEAVGDLINQAAGQVAKLKLRGGVGPGPTKNNSLMGPPGQLYPGPSVIRNNNLQKNKPKQHTQGGVMWYNAVGRVGQVSGTIYPSQARVHGPATRPIPLPGGGSAGQNGRAGTGVFLPRRYGNNNNNNNNKNDKKTGHSSGYVPDRSVHSLNKDFNSDTGGFAQSQPRTQNRGFASDYDLRMARRNAVMLQHGVILVVSHGDCYLPQQGWTY